MSDTEYSKDALLAFIRQCVDTGMLNPAAARSRQNAARQLLGFLDEDESADLRQLDVDELAGRVHKLEGTSIRPESLNIYRDRLASTLTDFLQWKSQPDGFAPRKDEQRSLRRRPSVGQFNEQSGEDQALEELRLNPPRKEIFPIPLREGLVVYLQNVPADLTAAEAAKIAAVAQALATGNEAEES